MRVLQIHTRHRFSGGEERVVDEERDLLRSAGVQVSELIFDNNDPRPGLSVAGDVRLAISSCWSSRSSRLVEDAIELTDPDVVHVHNTFVAGSPSVIGTAHRLGRPVVQTIHNYRPVCPVGVAFRSGRPCLDCSGRCVAWPAVLHRCHEGSLRQSAVAAGAWTVQRWLYKLGLVDLFVVLTQFQRLQLIRGGIANSRIRVVPNFIVTHPPAPASDRQGFGFIGRLSPEKGIDTLLRAARDFHGSITVAGDGPLREVVERAASQGVVVYIGRIGTEGVRALLNSVVAAIVPSAYFEGFPLVVLEAFASGTPVIASRLGSLSEIVRDGETGILFDPGDWAALATQLRWASQHPDEMRAMGEEARREAERRFSPEGHLGQLLRVYAEAVDRHKARA